MPSSSKGHKTLPRCTFQARLQQLSPLPGRRRHRSLSSPKTRGAVPHLPCHGHPGMRGLMMKRLTQAPCHSPETSPRPSRDVPAPADKDGDPPYRPEQSFFGVGGGTGEEGAVFTKNAPSPLAIIFLCLPATAGGSWHPPGPRWLPRRARLQGCGSAGGSAGLPAPGGWCSAG